jgi:hypothetical protein
MVMAPGRTTEEALSWSTLGTGRIMFVVPATGRAACITFGGQDIGGLDTASESGYTAITLREDTKLGLGPALATVGRNAGKRAMRACVADYER